MIFWSFLSVIICFFIFGLINRLSKDSKANIIKINIFFMFVGIIIMTLVIILSVYLYLNINDPNSGVILKKDGIPFMILIGIMFFCAGLFLVSSYFNYRIIYDVNGFIYKDLLGRKKHYSYNDIKWYTYGDSYFGTSGNSLNKFESESDNAKRFRNSLKFATLELGIEDKRIQFMLSSGIPNFISYIKKYKTDEQETDSDSKQD